VFADGALVSPRTLVAEGIVNRVDGKPPLVKILSVGETTKKFTISQCVISATAKEKLEKAGSVIK
jgi:ribosomal protein L15